MAEVWRLERHKGTILKSTYSYKKGEEIYGQGKAATYCYQLVNGAICILSKLTNGRRQIGAFYFPGDVFGLDPTMHYRWSAEAIVEATTVRRVKRKALLRKASSNLSFARGVRSIAERDLLHGEDHRILLGQLTARERSYRQILVTAGPVRRRRLWADGRSAWR